MELTTIPTPIIAVVADIFSDRYTHTQINSQFYSAGFPGDPPEGNKQEKCHSWLRRANKELPNPLEMVGALLRDLMETVPATSVEDHPSVLTHRNRIVSQLSVLGLSYQTGGHIVFSGTSAASRALEQIAKERDLKGVQSEFDRIHSNIERDPPAAVTASCALLESLFKSYIADEGLNLPADESLLSLWKVVRGQLRLDPSEVQDDSLK